MGISVGTNVVIARYIGSGNEKRANSAAHTAVLVSVICGFVIMALGLLVSPLILNLIGTPDDYYRSRGALSAHIFLRYAVYDAL
ncbi:MAG: hypothetical protein L6V93_17195 [Clostridiales bacterium]|nr:MAG: hypothetical protein L6V93_17195 [Clostridiales bacterium]